MEEQLTSESKSADSESMVARDMVDFMKQPTCSAQQTVALLTCLPCYCKPFFFLQELLSYLEISKHIQRVLPILELWLKQPFATADFHDSMIQILFSTQMNNIIEILRPICSQEDTNLINSVTNLYNRVTRSINLFESAKSTRAKQKKRKPRPRLASDRESNSNSKQINDDDMDTKPSQITAIMPKCPFILVLFPSDLAELLTVLEFEEYYSRVSLREFVGVCWTKRELKQLDPIDGGALNVMNWIESVDRLTFVVADEILFYTTNIGPASEVLSYYLEVAYHCLELNNFSTVFQIVTALSMPAIKALKSGWSGISEKYSQLFRQLRDFSLDSASNYGRYRTLASAVSQSPEPFVPVLQVFLRDIMSLESSEPWVTKSQTTVTNIVAQHHFDYEDQKTDVTVDTIINFIDEKRKRVKQKPETAADDNVESTGAARRELDVNIEQQTVFDVDVDSNRDSSTSSSHNTTIQDVYKPNFRKAIKVHRSLSWFLSPQYCQDDVTNRRESAMEQFDASSSNSIPLSSVAEVMEIDCGAKYLIDTTPMSCPSLPLPFPVIEAVEGTPRYGDSRSSDKRSHSVVSPSMEAEIVGMSRLTPMSSAGKSSGSISSISPVNFNIAAGSLMGLPGIMPILPTPDRSSKHRYRQSSSPMLAIESKMTTGLRVSDRINQIMSNRWMWVDDEDEYDDFIDGGVGSEASGRVIRSSNCHAFPHSIYALKHLCELMIINEESFSIALLIAKKYDRGIDWVPVSRSCLYDVSRVDCRVRAISIQVNGWMQERVSTMIAKRSKRKEGDVDDDDDDDDDDKNNKKHVASIFMPNPSSTSWPTLSTSVPVHSHFIWHYIQHQQASAQAIKDSSSSSSSSSSSLLSSSSRQSVAVTSSPPLFKAGRVIRLRCDLRVLEYINSTAKRMTKRMDDLWQEAKRVEEFENEKLMSQLYKVGIL